MQNPLEITFRVLSASPHPMAVDLLLEAVDSTDDRIRLHAADALLKCRQTRGLLALVRRLESFSAPMREHLKKNRQGLEHALHQAIVHGDPAVRQQGLIVMQWMETLELLPLLFSLLEKGDHPDRELVRQTISVVTHQLYDHMQAEKNGVQGWWISYQPLSTLIHDVLMYLDHALSKAKMGGGAEEVIEGLLMLGRPDQESVKKIFRHSERQFREYAYALMKTSRHSGIMQLVNAFLAMPYLPPMVFDIFAIRDDLEFILESLRSFPRRMNAHHQKNYRSIQKLSWAARELAILEMIPDADQVSLVKFVSATGIPDEDKQYILEWMMRCGGHDGKEAAAQMRRVFDEETLRGIVLDGLDSENEDDQVWATHQLRSLAMPETFRLLIDRLNSPTPSVRDAARDELRSFNLQTALDLFETLDPAVCRRTGELLMKIDPDTLDALRRELTQPGARKRIRAIRGAMALGLSENIIDDLMMLLGDEDAIVRRTAVEALGALDHPDARDALLHALNDPNPRVRYSVESVLHRRNTQDKLHSGDVLVEADASPHAGP
ncbi:MAG: HEAT repeat domain-containing protein [Planctomycetaceae bacterium]